jgi:hypothetical protein
LEVRVAGHVGDVALVETGVAVGEHVFSHHHHHSVVSGVVSVMDFMRFFGLKKGLALEAPGTRRRRMGDRHGTGQLQPVAFVHHHRLGLQVEEAI